MPEHVPEDRGVMSIPELVDWAWRETPPVHKNSANLLIHLVAVPLFALGHFLIVAGIFTGPWVSVTGILNSVASLAAQKFGHSLEQTPVHAFTGAADFFRRLYAEQFCNFWRFLFSGQWYASLRASQSGA